MGRPKLPHKTETVGTRLRTDEIKALDVYAKRRGLTRSSAIREIVVAAAT